MVRIPMSNILFQKQTNVELRFAPIGSRFSEIFKLGGLEWPYRRSSDVVFFSLLLASNEPHTLFLFFTNRIFSVTVHVLN